MLVHLPEQLKSGRVLVATAADGNVGLYTFPDLDDDYRVVTLSGKVWRGDGETIPQPPEGRWRYLGDDDDTLDDPLPEEAVVSGPTDAATAGAPASSTHLCVDCEQDTRVLDHAHTLGHPAAAICCRCAEERGYACPLAAREWLAEVARA